MKPKASRRTFVQAASAAIATAQFPILGANDRIQVGIVGLGGRGTNHMDFYSTLDTDCRIAAVCDVNQEARERAVARVNKAKGHNPKEFDDMRKMFESKDVDAVSVATPNHWHALAAIWACQAGKDVYVEKPASHNIFEGRQMVAAARKYNRMVQVGSQSRSMPYKMKAIQLIREGAIGQVYHARALCYRRRFSIGHTPDEPAPAGLDWDGFLGPAQMKPYSKNKFAYNWHWFWDTGNGDIGNQGVHEMDISLWGLGRSGWPVTVSSSGGKYVWKDDQETPNTQQTTFDFGDMQMTFDVRNLPTPPEGLAAMRGPNYVGNIFFGSQGFLIVDGSGFQLYKGTAGNVSGEAARGAGAGSRERYEKALEEKPQGEDTTPHMKNFFDAIRARNYKLLTAEIEIGARAAAFCHLANISYRVGRTLRMAQSTGRFLGDDEANALLTRDYRAPYVVPAGI
jgi:predicted dehydrogenase